MNESVQKSAKIASYKDTLNLPKTPFAMKANLVQNEPATLKKWQELNLYNKIRTTRKGAPPYVFHDGPPYANGPIHLGHLLNKVLKDLIVRSKTMAGFDCPYIPGWDCHGLPIEHKVMQNLADKAKQMDAMQIRRRCQADAEKFIKLQSSQMQRLLTLADYDHPYITMAKAYESGVLEVFAELVAKGLIYRDFKPVAWSIENQTALAEAELEYENREDSSIYVLFELDEVSTQAAWDRFQMPGTHDGSRIYLMIWTTTPWTLPANMAVAASQGAEYVLMPVEVVGNKALAIVCQNLVDKIRGTTGSTNQKTIGTAIAGGQLEGLSYRHPFLSRHCPIVHAPYVSLEDGTGLVHTAPGHGQDDYKTGLGHVLHFAEGSKGVQEVKTASRMAGASADIYSPVKEDGTFDSSVPDWLVGKNVWQANGLILEKLRETGNLFFSHRVTHSYPHDWRSKKPIIFRATHQWFIRVDKPESVSEVRVDIRKSALEQIDGLEFIPAWGRNRMRGMLESRPDWCISRQRAWGLPIPVFYTPDGESLLTKASVTAVAEAIRKHGSDYWFKSTPEELLATYDVANDPDAPDKLKSDVKTQGLQSLGLRRGTDIFDVWFESGSSWHAVLEQRGFPVPADLYLEGSDQHRGWFQSSLLPALGARGKPPFKTVLTHGFMVDKDGRKMSKSLGNALEVETLLKDFGADVCRWWVCGLNTDNDIKVDPEFFKVAGEEYRKVRNTIRFLLSNLYDFDPRPEDEGGSRYAFSDPDAASPDAWALSELDQFIDHVKDGYTNFRFRKIHDAVFNFCNETLSAVYLAAVKDRLYCDQPDSPRRRRTQTAIYDIVDALIRLIAPVLPHTAEEAWHALKGDNADSVHLELFPAPSKPAADPRWPAVIQERDTWLKALEEARQNQGIDNPLDLGLNVSKQTPVAQWGSVAQLLDGFDVTDLADLCGVSRFEVTDEDPGVRVVDLRSQARCARSWKRDATVRLRSDGGLLSDRDAQAVGVA